MWTRDGRRRPISYLDPDALTRIFQAKVLDRWVGEHRLRPEFAARLRTWRHRGFQVYRADSVAPDGPPAWERWCASIGRAVFASTRVEYDPGTGGVSYRTAQAAELIPVGPLRVRVKLPEAMRPKETRVLVSGETLPAVVGSGWAGFEVRSIRDHEVVSLE